MKTANHNWRKFDNCFTVNGTFSKEQVAGMYLKLHLTTNENLSFSSCFVPLKTLSPHFPMEDKTALRSQLPDLGYYP